METNIRLPAVYMNDHYTKFYLANGDDYGKYNVYKHPTPLNKWIDVGISASKRNRVGRILSRPVLTGRFKPVLTTQ